jgi:hypothetical protein
MMANQTAREDAGQPNFTTASRRGKRNKKSRQHSNLLKTGIWDSMRSNTTR